MILFYDIGCVAAGCRLQGKHIRLIFVKIPLFEGRRYPHILALFGNFHLVWGGEARWRVLVDVFTVRIGLGSGDIDWFMVPVFGRRLISPIPLSVVGKRMRVGLAYKRLKGKGKGLFAGLSPGFCGGGFWGFSGIQGVGGPGAGRSLGSRATRPSVRSSECRLRPCGQKCSWQIP